MPSSLISKESSAVINDRGKVRAQLDVLAAGNIGANQDELEQHTIRQRRRLPIASTPAAFDPRDVNRDGQISPIDVLLVINRLNGMPAAVSSTARYDVNGDSGVSPMDVLAVINHLNRLQHDAEGEARSLALAETVERATAADLDEDLVAILAADASPAMLATDSWSKQHRAVAAELDDRSHESQGGASRLRRCALPRADMFWPRWGGENLDR